MKIDIDLFTALRSLGQLEAYFWCERLKRNAVSPGDDFKQAESALQSLANCFSTAVKNNEHVERAQ